MAIDGLSDEARAILERARVRESILDGSRDQFVEILQEHGVPFENVFNSMTYDDRLAVVIFFSSDRPYTDSERSTITELLTSALEECKSKLNLEGAQIEFVSDKEVKTKYNGDYDKWYVDN